MAHFRGTLQGSRGPASRLGTKKSCLRVEAQSWQGKVTVYLYERDDGIDCARVYLDRHHGEGTCLALYDGPVSGPVKGAAAKLTDDCPFAHA